MPRTVPTIDGSAQRKVVTVKWIDANNQRRSDSLHIDNAATDVQIEAIIAAMAAASNGNIYAVHVAQVYSANPNSGDATEAPRESIRDNVVMLFKNAVTNDGRDYFIPAPIDAMFNPGTNILNNLNAQLLAVRNAIDATLNTYEPISVRFTERRIKNPAVSI